jgi:hypothetical protein
MHTRRTRLDIEESKSREVSDPKVAAVVASPPTWLVRVRLVWRRRWGQPDQGSELRERILKTAAWLCGLHSVLDSAGAEQTLIVELTERFSEEVKICELSVRLIAEKPSVAFALRLEDGERRKIEMEYLRDEIFKDVSLAALWYVDGKRERLLELADENKQFDDAVARLTGGLRPDHGEEFLDLVRHARDNTRPDLWAYALSELANSLRTLGQTDLAEGVRFFIRQDGSEQAEENGENARRS